MVDVTFMLRLTQSCRKGAGIWCTRHICRVTYTLASPTHCGAHLCVKDPAYMSVQHIIFGRKGRKNQKIRMNEETKGWGRDKKEKGYLSKSMQYLLFCKPLTRIK